ncbi:hypothetical protein [Amycolatopsis sp. NPDC059021]|uniref:hypothetical protein n=1 Tax=Amycolatopsis sp. NPDC059021 TaxID=3346704 RepID=UPI00366AF4F0
MKLIMQPVTDEERPHVEALARLVLGGFKQVQKPGAEGLHYERRRGAVIDMVSVERMEGALAARWLISDYFDGDSTAEPLWHKVGTVAEVVRALLALPPDGAPGAPTLPVPRSSDLLIPPGGLLLPHGS